MRWGFARPSACPTSTVRSWLTCSTRAKVRGGGVVQAVCHVTPHMLTRPAVPPAVNQVEMHPYLTQPTLLAFMRRCNVAVTAFSPLGIGSYLPLGASGDSVLTEPCVQAIAARTARTPAQVEWHCIMLQF